MDRNSTLQASLKARGPIFFNQSIELNKLNNFRSICLYKIFTSKKILEWTEIRLSRRALRPMGLIFVFNRQSSINLTTFVLYVFRRYLQVKSYESKCFNILSIFFVDFRVQASFGAFGATSMKILTCAYLYVVYIP